MVPNGLDIISFVGVDSQTDIEAVNALNSLHVMEFGVLYSEARAGKGDPRYPSFDFCNTFANECRHNTSLHICGTEAVMAFLDQRDEIIQLAQEFIRVQLNFNIMIIQDVERFVDKIKEITVNKYLTVILQANKTKKKVIDYLQAHPQGAHQIQLLHDGSGGFGRQIKIIHEPFDKFYTGYAGGINPENVVEIVNDIDRVNKKKVPYYIDMESGVRTNNVFDLTKVKAVLDKVAQHESTSSSLPDGD